MSITNPTYRHYNNWMAGLSDDSYISAPGQFSYGFGVDIRRNPRYVQLQRKQTKKHTTTSLAYCFLTVGNNTFSFTDDGKVYYTDGTNVYTAASGVYEAIEFNSTVYMFRSNNVTTIPSANCTLTAASWTGTNNYSLGASGLNRFAINYLDAKLFFTEDKKLRYFDSAAPTTPVDTAFSSNSHIVGISQHGDSIWIYCQDGRMYAYDIGNNVVIGTKDFQEPITAVRPNADVDFVVTVGSYLATTWINSGVQPGSQALLKKAKYDETVSQVYSVDSVFGFTGTVSSQNGCLLRSTLRMIGVHSSGLSQAIYSYGKKGDGFPYGWAVDYTKNADGNAMAEIGAIYRTTNGFFYSWKYSTTYGVDYVDTENIALANGYLSTGELFTNWDDTCLSLQSGVAEADREMRKEISWVKMGAIIPTGCTIDLYYLLDGQAGTGTLYKSFGPSDAVDTSSFREFTPISTQFSQIRWRIVLNGNGTNTPRLFDLKYALQPVNES